MYGLDNIFFKDTNVPECSFNGLVCRLALLLFFPADASHSGADPNDNGEDWVHRPGDDVRWGSHSCIETVAQQRLLGVGEKIVILQQLAEAEDWG